MKKSVMLLAAALVLTLSLGLCACGKKGDDISVHFHQPVWKFDKDKHYRVCVDCGMEIEEGEHVGEDYCEICQNYVGFTVGLSYELNAEGTGYILTGRGKAKDSDIDVPEYYRDLPVLSVKEGAFAGKSEITSVSFHGGVTEIGENAFEGCSNLRSVNLFQNIEVIGSRAFMRCPISKITIPANTREIGNKAFYGCDQLTEVTFLGEKIEAIEESLFKRCYSLTKINIPDSVEVIGDSSFQECENLSEVSLGENLKKIEQNAFFGCKSFEQFTLPESLETIDRNAFLNSGFLLNSSNQKNGLYISGGWLISSDLSISGEVEIPEGVKFIAKMAFEDRKKISAVRFPKSLQKIDRYAFSRCDGIQSVVFADTEGWTYENESNFIPLQDETEALEMLLGGKVLQKE